MNKPHLLRTELTGKIPYLRDNPEYLHLFVEDGAVLATLAPSLSYEYEYTLNLIIEAYPGDQNILMAVVGHWLREHQPDIFANPDNRRSGFTFDVNILNDQNGAANSELIDIVTHALNDEDVRPVADRLTVQSAKIVNYAIDAVLYLYPTPEYEPILQGARARLARYTAEQHRIGRDIVRSAIFAALHVSGVQRVELKQPQKDMILDKTQASYCTSAHITLGGSDE